MNTLSKLSFFGLLTTSLIACGGNGGGGSTGSSTIETPSAETSPPAPSYKLEAWMHPDVESAWESGYFGQGAHLVIVDDFNSGETFYGNLSGADYRTHGEWVADIASRIAFQADETRIDYNGNGADLKLNPSELNIINASYGIPVASPFFSSLGRIEQQIVEWAHSGEALVVFSAGNDGLENAIGERVYDPSIAGLGSYDLFAIELEGAQAALFVGSLDRNGTVNNLANTAQYNTIPGDNEYFQNHYLLAGVDETVHGLSGTSFAAPVISGYAAIIGSKFDTATPTQIANHMLDTARTDTIVDYDPYYDGQGEACLSCALAPVSIN